MQTRTYANNVGIWHAAVDASQGTYRAQQQRARRAIVREILERSPRGTTAKDISVTVRLLGESQETTPPLRVFRES